MSMLPIIARLRRSSLHLGARTLAGVALLPLLLVACSSGGGTLGDATGKPTSPHPSVGHPADGQVTIATSLTVTDDPATTASAAMTVAAGGTVSVTAEDGTVFELDVPADVLAADTTITATATDVRGIDGAASLHAVHFEPEGLQFTGTATLKIHTPTPIGAGHALPFQSAADGSGPELAFVDDGATDDTTVAVIVQHFSVWGVAELVDAVTDIIVVHDANSSESQLQGEIARDVEIRRNLLHGGHPTDEIDLQLQQLFIEYQDKVITPLMERAGGSCDGLLRVAHATSNYYYLWLHNSVPSSVASMKKVAETAFLQMENACESERIDQCVASADHTVLSSFWRNMNNWRIKFGYAKKQGDDPAQYDYRAKKICKGYAYYITGGLQDFQVHNVKVCDVRKPFTLSSPGIATAQFSGGDSLSGSYSATGVFNLSYAGSYTITLPAGPGEPGTMTGTSGGQIHGQAGSGTETYQLTPAFMDC